MTVGPDQLRRAIESMLSSPRLVTALSTTSIGVAACAFAIRQTMGSAALIAIVVTLVILASASIFASRESIQWRGLLPLSLLIFLGWAGASIIWSQYQWSTLGGLAYLGCFSLLGFYVALLRDTIQIVRAFGDVLRVVLAVSLAVEIIAGALIDAPIEFLHVLGRLDEFGPIQGISGTRNQLAVVAVIALVTFGTELRTRSVPRGLAIGSIVLAAVDLVLTRSPLGFGSLAILGVAAAALYGLRRAERERRKFWQVGLLVATVVGLGAAWALRGSVVTLFNASGDLTYRLDVWRRAWDLIALNPLQGWGWIGAWPNDIAPFRLFTGLGRATTSASNAFVDVWLQLGLVGLAIFVGLVGLAFVRSWLLASRRRSIVFAWPALVLVVLVTTALGESSLLLEFGWLTFVVCTIKAAQQLSWRQAFATPDETVLPQRP